MPKLGVNIDHVATLREARGTVRPCPVQAAKVCVEAGCDSVVCHLREDRRHIKDEDVVSLRRIAKTRLNLEMSVAREIVAFACEVRPDQATLVPERRRELTTEGGLDVRKNARVVSQVVAVLKSKGIEVSLFINPARPQIDAAIRVGAGVIELHTGEYANASSPVSRRRQLLALKRSSEYALSRGLEVNAGHGLDYDNVRDIALIDGLNELNIGHSIISRAVFVGLARATTEMLELIR